jgi:hypothetical protein
VTRGSAWYYAKQFIGYGFETNFTFRFSSASGDIRQVIADGFAFLVQNSGDLALGEGGCYMGYDTIPYSIAIEFDPFTNRAGEINPYCVQIHDERYEHVALQAEPTGHYATPISASHLSGFTSWIPARADLIQDGIHTVRIVYLPPARRLATLPTYRAPCQRLAGTDIQIYGVWCVFIDNMNFPVFVHPTVRDVWDEPGSGLGLTTDGFSYVGFTGATGAFTQNHDILSWSFQPFGCVSATGMITARSADIPCVSVPTNTPTKTYTPSVTYTPTRTSSPTYTQTPSATPTIQAQISPGSTLDGTPLSECDSPASAGASSGSAAIPPCQITTDTPVPIVTNTRRPTVTLPPPTVTPPPPSSCSIILKRERRFRIQPADDTGNYIFSLAVPTPIPTPGGPTATPMSNGTLTYISGDQRSYLWSMLNPALTAPPTTPPQTYTILKAIAKVGDIRWETPGFIWYQVIIETNIGELRGYISTDGEKDIYLDPACSASLPKPARELLPRPPNPPQAPIFPPAQASLFGRTDAGYELPVSYMGVCGYHRSDCPGVFGSTIDLVPRNMELCIDTRAFALFDECDGAGGQRRIKVYAPLPGKIEHMPDGTFAIDIDYGTPPSGLTYTRQLHFTHIDPGTRLRSGKDVAAGEYIGSLCLNSGATKVTVCKIKEEAVPTHLAFKLRVKKFSPIVYEDIPNPDVEVPNFLDKPSCLFNDWVNSAGTPTRASGNQFKSCLP